MKIKRLLSMLLAAVMVLSLLPSGILSTVARAAGIEEMEAYVSAQQYFTADQYDTLKSYYDTCVANSYTTAEVPSLERLKNAVTALAAGADFYDDFRNIGEYMAASEIVEGIGAVGIEPENAGDFFQTVTNTTNYEIRYGGLVAQRYTAETKPENIKDWKQTWPYVYSFSGESMKLQGFHFSEWYYEDCTWNSTALNDWASSNALNRTQNEYLHGKQNWLTLKESVADGELSVLTVRASNTAYPKLVYNYVDGNNFNYIWLTGQNTDIFSVEVKDGVYTSTKIVQFGVLKNYITIGGTDNTVCQDIQLVWNENLCCYNLAVMDMDGNRFSVDLTQELTQATLPYNKVKTVQFADNPAINGANILSNIKSVSFARSVNGYAESRIEREVPELSAVVRTDLAALTSLYNELQTMMSEESFAGIENINKLTEAIMQAQRLQQEYESGFRLSEVWDFEDGGKYVWTDLFEQAGTKGSVQTVSNPEVGVGNSSAKVLQIKDGIMKLVDALGGRTYVVSGKVYGAIQVYAQYYDESNYQLVTFGGTKVGNYNSRVNDENNIRVEATQVYGQINFSCIKEGAGIRQDDYGGDTLGMPERTVKAATGWSEFEIRISGTQIILSYGVWGDDGNFYVQNVIRTASKIFDEACSVAFGNGYLDDLTVTILDTDESYEAEDFLSANENILNLYPYEKHLSATDAAAYEKLLEDYAALTDAGKAAVGPIYAKLVAQIQAAYSEITPEAKEYDELLQSWAQENYRLPEGADYSREFTAFTGTEDDDNLSLWEAGYRYYGIASIAEDAALGRNVLHLRNSSIYVLKDAFTPEKGVISEISYHIDPVDLTPDWGAVNSADAVPGIVVYLYYKDAQNYMCYRFVYNRYQLMTVKSGVATYADTYYEQNEDFKIDVEKGFDVSIKYANDEVKILLTGADGAIWEKEESYSSLEKNRVAFSCFATAGYRAYNISEFAVNIRDIRVKFTKGDWDENVTQTDINVSYTGNTYQSPGDVALIRGENLGTVVRKAEIIQVSNLENPALGYIDYTAYDYAGVSKGEFTLEPTQPMLDWSKAITLDIVHKTTDSIQFVIPKSFSHGIYAVRLSTVVNRQTVEKIVYLNAPVIDFYLGSDGEMASPGTELELVGENLAPNQNTNTESVAYELRTKDRDLEDVHVRLVNHLDPSIWYELEIKEITSDYNIVAIIPSEITVAADGSTTDWEVYVYNGYGDSTCWSVPQIIKIGRPLSELRPTNFINIMDYGATGNYLQDATAIMQKALNDLNEMGGGTLYMPEGHYRLSYTVYMPENVTIQGDGQALTNIIPTYINFAYGELPVTTGIVITNNCTIDGVGFYLKRARSVIATKDLSENVTINDVKFYTNYTSWANNSLGQGGNLVDRFEMYKYNESYDEDHAFIKGAFDNFKLTNINADTNVNGLCMMNSYTPNCDYGKFENIVYDSGTQVAWLRAIFNNGVWKNCQLYGGTANHGYGVYMYNCTFGPAPGYNRELWVADRSAFTNFRYQIYTDEAAGITQENSVYLKIAGVTDITGYEWFAEDHVQIYFINGNGAGQTAEAVDLDYEKNCLVIKEPLAVPVNRNTEATTRASPREDIYFVDCTFHEGGCPGGFYGGCADVVHDGDHMNYAFAQYYQAIYKDVNWYCSMVNSVWDNTPYSLIAAYGMRKGSSYYFTDDGSNLDNSQLGILIRNNVITNMQIFNDARSSGKQKDFIIDHNVFDGLEYIMDGSKTAVPDGLTFYRNSGNELVGYTGSGLSPTGNNSLGYTYVTYLDELGDERSYLLGDVNMDGQISLKDVTVIHYAVADMINLTEKQLLLADVNGDGAVTAVDATYIRNYLLSAIDKFPAEPEEPEPDESQDATIEPDVDDDDYTPGYH